MTKDYQIAVPDLGGADEVEVIDILVDIGDHVEADTPLLTLESDKASMDIPSPRAGTIKSLAVATGDKVSEGMVIATLEARQTKSQTAPPVREEPADDSDLKTSLLVIGSGPGGYTAAFRAADLGLDVTLVERYSDLGGVCLNVGCIPSKALLHSAAVISQARAMHEHGIKFAEPEINLDQLRVFKLSVIGKLTSGLASMAKSRKVNIINGYARFLDANSVSIENDEGKQTLRFDQAIIAAGSRVSVLPGFDIDDPRIMDSTDALDLADIPPTLLIIGGGIIGLEMATVYSELGSEVSIVEFMPQIMPGADKDLLAPLNKRLKSQLFEIMTNTKVEKIEPLNEGLMVHFSDVKSEQKIAAKRYDKILVATGRRPNGDLLDADKAGIQVDERGFVPVDAQMRTNVAHIFAIGDIVGQPMLAHKATHEAKVAAEVCAGEKSAFDATVIPSVAYTDPEVAWVGLTETQARADGTAYEAASFPWAASGRAIGNDRTDGKTKLLFDPNSKKIIGGGIVGTQAGDLIAEIALAIEMGADVHDIALTIHPHPTLAESVAMAAEVYDGSITDLYIPKIKSH